VVEKTGFTQKKMLQYANGMNFWCMPRNDNFASRCLCFCLRSLHRSYTEGAPGMLSHTRVCYIYFGVELLVCRFFQNSKSAPAMEAYLVLFLQMVAYGYHRYHSNGTHGRKVFLSNRSSFRFIPFQCLFTLF